MSITLGIKTLSIGGLLVLLALGLQGQSLEENVKEMRKSITSLNQKFDVMKINEQQAKYYCMTSALRLTRLAEALNCSEHQTLEENVKEMRTSITSLNQKCDVIKVLLTSHVHAAVTSFPTDCADVYARGRWSHGSYVIEPRGHRSFSVGCEDGWTVIQRRDSGNLSFDRDWIDYLHGFGSVSGEHWLGLEYMHRLTQQDSYRLRLEFLLDDRYNDTALNFIQFEKFTVGPGPDYRLGIAALRTNMLDTRALKLLNETLNEENGMAFTTRDKDVDTWAHKDKANRSGENCAEIFKGGWWYWNCTWIHPNGWHSGCTGKNKACIRMAGITAKSIVLKIRR